MAKRRMMSVEVGTSDEFNLLTKSAQALYLQLNLSADDDGIVDKWKTILRSTRTKREHLDALIDSGYVLMLDDGSVLISDWLIHNNISLKRYSAGRYKNKLDTVLMHRGGRYFKASEVFLTPQVK